MCWETTSALTVDLPSPCLCSFFLERNFLLCKNFSILKGFNKKNKNGTYTRVLVRRLSEFQQYAMLYSWPEIELRMLSKT